MKIAKNMESFFFKNNQSTKFSIQFVFMLFLMAFFTSIITPSFMSPDEFDHIKRAYLLRQGVIALDARESGSGGMIDSGLLSYMKEYQNFIPSDTKLTKDLTERASRIQWTGTKNFSNASGTAYYFPLIYTPQAIGLTVGESLGLSVELSYKLARFITLIFIVGLLIFSFRIYEPPLIVMGLLIIPMSLFQVSSASLDGISSALAIFAVSAFIRIAVDRKNANSQLLFLLSASVFIVASCRAHLMPMVFLVFGTFFFTKDKKSIVAGLVTTFLLLIWLAFAINTTIHRELGFSKGSIVVHYLSNPLDFFNVISSTLSNKALLIFYKNSFFGILGWLDASFATHVYNYLVYATLILFILSISVSQIRTYLIPAALIIFASVISVLLVFVSLLISWTPHPASVIEGVQGRYFLVPAIMICYGLTLQIRQANFNKVYKLTGILALSLLALFSTFKTNELLLERYFVTDEQLRTLKTGSYVGGHIYGELVKGSNFSQTFRADGGYIFKMRILLATFDRKNSGLINFSVDNEEGSRLFEKIIDVENLIDNAWVNIDAEAFPVVKGQTYVLRLTSINGLPGNSVTWRASPVDSYSNGKAIVNSTSVEGDFAFEVFSFK